MAGAPVSDLKGVLPGTLSRLLCLEASKLSRPPSAACARACLHRLFSNVYVPAQDPVKDIFAILGIRDHNYRGPYSTCMHTGLQRKMLFNVAQGTSMTALRQLSRQQRPLQAQVPRLCDSGATRTLLKAGRLEIKGFWLSTSAS